MWNILDKLYFNDYIIAMKGKSKINEKGVSRMIKFKFKKTNDEDERDVYANEKLIGRIAKGWNRNGGEGWSLLNSKYSATSKTMKEAASRMVREIKENENNYICVDCHECGKKNYFNADDCTVCKYVNCIQCFALLKNDKNFNK